MTESPFSHSQDTVAPVEPIEITQDVVEEVTEEVIASVEATEEVAAEVAEAVAVEEIEEEDPITAFAEKMRILPGDWYVVHSYAGFENRVKGNIENRINSLNMEDYIYQVEVPIEEVTERLSLVLDTFQ